MGAVVLLVAGIFLTVSLSTATVGRVSGYELTAKFNRVDGLVVGADVRVSGIKIGSVTSQTLEPDSFQAVVRMNIQKDVKLPIDSSAEVVSDGLLGSKYMALVPGGDEKALAPGGQIKYTQSTVSLEALIGQLIFSGKGDGEKPGEQKSK
ncbi:MAG: outer membrane lipid asymmetry maintenance protein MlaD [Alphaproteobacteria bacterium]|nr:outer membrane lipid asymmetry maintenance protein MlaD [Alphaproteobacteria bacterium]